MKKLTSEVPAGLGTVLGLIGTVAAAVVMIVQSISENEALLNGQNKAAGLIAFAIAILTALGRMYQAANKEGPSVLPEVPEALAELVQGNVETVKKNPDGVDGPHVGK